VNDRLSEQNVSAFGGSRANPGSLAYCSWQSASSGITEGNHWLVRITVQHLIYGYTSVLVGDAAADVILEYAVALNQSRLSDLVTVPTTDHSGYVSTVRLLLAPGIPLMAEPAPDDDLEHEHRGFVAELRTRIVAVLTASTVPPARTT